MAQSPARPLQASRGTDFVLCVDSPGWGGSEKDLIRVLEMIDLQPQAVICSEAISPELERFFIARHIRLIPQHSANSWRNAFSGIWHAASLVKKFPKSTVFVVWAHHSDSNRWLQVALVLLGRRPILIERALTPTPESLSYSRLTKPLKQLVARFADLRRTATPTGCLLLPGSA